MRYSEVHFDLWIRITDRSGWADFNHFPSFFDFHVSPLRIYEKEKNMAFFRPTIFLRRARSRWISPIFVKFWEQTPKRVGR